MKRFTETEKWRDPWFRKLSVQAKLLFLWLVDNCDKAGVIDFDIEAASFQIGEPIKMDHLVELQGRWEKLPNGKIRLLKFITFQYGKLSKTCPPHARIFEALDSHGLSYPDFEISSTTLPTTLPATLPARVEERKGMEWKRNGKEEEGGTGGNGELDPEFVKELLAMYRRSPDSALEYAEQSALAQIIREHSRWREEWRTIAAFKVKEPRFFPQSLSRLLSGWQDILDRANQPTISNGAKTIFELSKVIEAKTKLADDLKNKHSSQGPLSTDWDFPENRKEFGEDGMTPPPPPASANPLKGQI
jgi:hypothetical protein